MSRNHTRPMPPDFAHLDDAGTPSGDDFLERRREAGALIWLGFALGLMACAILATCAG